MQPAQASKPVQLKGAGPSVNRSKIVGSTKDQSSRQRNTSEDDAGAGGRTLVMWDGKNMTPKSLVPSQYLKDQRAEGASGPGAGQEERPAAEEGQRPSAAEEPAALPATASLEKARANKATGLSKEELDKNVDIILSETETDTLLFFPSLCIALDNPQSAAVSKRNKVYEELCSSKADSDQYRDQHAQTIYNPHKQKEVFAAPPTTETVEVNANGWDIYDTFATDPVPKHEQIQQACDKESAATVAQAIKKPGCLFTMNEPYPTNELAVKEPVAKAAAGKKAAKKQGTGLGAGLSASGASAMVNPGSTAKGLSANATSDSIGGNPLGATNSADNDPAAASLGATGTANAESPVSKGEANAGEQGGDEVTLLGPPQPEDVIPWKVGADSPIPGELGPALRVMERIVSQNVFHKQHMIYRNYPTLEELAKLDELRAEETTGGAAADTSAVGSADAGGAGRPAAGTPTAAEGANIVDEGEGLADEMPEEPNRDDTSLGKPSLQDLFCFNAPQLTQDMTVTCAEWNRHNQDLLAVSYGDTAPVPNIQGGLVLFWSLKNPTYPERVIRTRQGVTALHFSSVHPNMVAAGTHDGSVMIWDLRRESDLPVLKSGSSLSTHNDQKHTDIVWETRWVDQGPDKQPPELLVSVGSDGDVLRWSMKKGLERMLLMQLKRVPNPFLGSNSVYGHKEGIVFRKSSGFCVDFPRHDSSTYLVGTEDGLVHRCSTSYNEQYLDTYKAHSGPVYRVRCNPFMSHAFLTCSADWTMKLWTTKPIPGHQPDMPVMIFQSINLSDAVNDVIWAPHNSTSFAAAMDDGRVELWDLSERPLDPIVVHYPQAAQAQRRRTCVRFSPNSPVLVAGDDKGSVDVMRMYNTNEAYYSDQEQQDRLNTVMLKKR